MSNTKKTITFDEWAQRFMRTGQKEGSPPKQIKVIPCGCSRQSDQDLFKIQRIGSALIHNPADCKAQVVLYQLSFGMQIAKFVGTSLVPRKLRSFMDETN